MRPSRPRRGRPSASARADPGRRRGGGARAARPGAPSLAGPASRGGRGRAPPARRRLGPAGADRRRRVAPPGAAAAPPEGDGPDAPAPLAGAGGAASPRRTRGEGRRGPEGWCGPAREPPPPRGRTATGARHPAPEPHPPAVAFAHGGRAASKTCQGGTKGRRYGGPGTGKVPKRHPPGGPEGPPSGPARGAPSPPADGDGGRDGPWGTVAIRRGWGVGARATPDAGAGRRGRVRPPRPTAGARRRLRQARPHGVGRAGLVGTPAGLRVTESQKMGGRTRRCRVLSPILTAWRLRLVPPASRMVPFAGSIGKGDRRGHHVPRAVRGGARLGGRGRGVPPVPRTAPHPGPARDAPAGAPGGARCPPWGTRRRQRGAPRRWPRGGAAGGGEGRAGLVLRPRQPGMRPSSGLPLTPPRGRARGGRGGPAAAGLSRGRRRGGPVGRPQPKKDLIATHVDRDALDGWVGPCPSARGNVPSSLGRTRETAPPRLMRPRDPGVVG